MNVPLPFDFAQGRLRDSLETTGRVCLFDRNDILISRSGENSLDFSPVFESEESSTNRENSLNPEMNIQIQIPFSRRLGYSLLAKRQGKKGGEKIFPQDLVFFWCREES